MEFPSGDSAQPVPLATADGEPPAALWPEPAAALCDVSLVDAIRSISKLEAERSVANRAFNDALVRSFDVLRQLAEARAEILGLRRRLDETERESVALNERFLQYLRTETDRFERENVAMEARVRALRAGTIWRLGLKIRSLRASYVRWRRRT